MPAAITGSLGFLAHQLATRTRARFEAALGESNLHLRHYLVLLVLRDEGPQAQQAVGARVGLDRTTTMEAAQTLEAGGFITRRDHPTDRRVYQLALTPAGRRLVTALEARIRRADLEVLAPLSPEERAELHRLLSAVLEHDADIPSDC